ncbi:hypothetical protein ACHWQZ_G001465 [Mnemiopsis leidyi]
MLRIFLLLNLLPSLFCSFTKNILVTTPWTGGHFSFPLDIAVSLAKTGHNVTFLALLKDPNIPIPDNINFLEASNISKEIRSLEYLNEVAVKSGALDCPSKKLISRSITGNQIILEETLKQIKLRFEYFFEMEMEKLLDDTKFDLIIVEETIFHPLAVIARRLAIPLVTAISVVDQQRAKNEQNYPVLLTSEASQFLNIEKSTPPSFLERAELFLELGLFIFRLVPGIMNIMAEHLEVAGLKSLTDLDKATQLYLVNDHPAISFPNLKAPNSINVAGIGFNSSTSRLEDDQDLSLFVESAKFEGKEIVYVSLGTLAFSMDFYSHIFGDEFLKALLDLGKVAVIVRSDRKYPKLSGVFAKSWLPQKGLLASSTSLFISSCGNNAKIEAVLSEVPLLCIPLFTDQYFNSLLVRRNQFGEILLKEDFSFQALQKLTSFMLMNREKFVNKMRAASKAVLQNPATPEQSLVFYCNLLMQHGHLDYLRNEVITGQSILEIYNLDVVGLLVLLVLVGLLVLLVIVYSICKKITFVGWRVLGKARKVTKKIERKKKE